MTTDKTDKLIQIGNFQLILFVAAIFGMFTAIKTGTVLDEHVQSRGAAVEKALEQQTTLLRDLQNEVRRLQDQRRTLDELKAALREGAPAYAPPVYVTPQAPQVQAPSQPQAPQTPAATGGQAPAERAAPPTSTEPAAKSPGEGASNTEAMGLTEAQVQADPKAVVGGTLVEATSEPSTWNLYTTSEGTTRTISDYFLEQLFMVSEKDPNKLQGMLATSWETSEDRLTCTYHLRHDVTWSDGAPFTAADVLFTYDTIQDKAVRSEPYKNGYVDVESVKKLDDFTIEVKFKRPYWGSLYVLGTTSIIPRHWYQAKVRAQAEKTGVTAFGVEPGEPGFGELFNKINEPPVGTGPYIVTSWVAGEQMLLERNPTHWRQSLEANVWNIQTRKVRFIPDQLAIMNQVRQQRVDVQVVKVDEYLDSLSKEKVIAENFKYYVYDHIRLGFNYMAWNCRKFPFDDARVRTAMTHLVDRAGMLRDIWRNNGTVATCPNKPIYPEYNKALAPHAFDPAKAAQLLKEAGFEDHDGDGVLDKKVGDVWKKFEFEFKVPSGYAEYERIANRVQEAAERVGIRMLVRPLEWSVFYKDLKDLNFDAVCLYNSFSDPWIDHYQSLHSSEVIPNGGNLPGLAMPELDKLVDEARREFDREKRIVMYHRIYEILHEQQPMTLLIHGKVNVLLHKRFQNVAIKHRGMRATYWWVDPTWKMPE